MTDQLLIRNQVDGILYLTLNNPDRRNSLSGHLLAGLKDSLDDIQAVSYTHLTLPTIFSV